MSKQLRELQSRKTALIKEARALTERAAVDNRDMNDEDPSFPRGELIRIAGPSQSANEDCHMYTQRRLLFNPEGEQR